MDMGFHKAGYEILYATDNWELACQSLKANNYVCKVECDDIRNIRFKQVLRTLNDSIIDCLIGGPPCPAYSKSRFYLTHKKRALEDENAYTLKEYFRVVSEINPKVYLFENVHGFAYKPHMSALNFLMSMSKRLGYTVSYKILNAAMYGVPQTRKRFICVGAKTELPIFVFPEETHYNPEKSKPNEVNGRKPWVTCGEAIGDLDVPLLKDVYMEAGSKDKELLKQVPPGDNYLFFTRERSHPNPIFKWRSRYWSFLLKLSPDRPSWTIQANQSNNMGPFHWRNRFLRIEEIKRIQTFDDKYVIKGSYKQQWRQIGNALPPLLTTVLATAIKEQYFVSKVQSK